MYFFFTTPNQLTGHERISPQRREKFFATFPLHILAFYGSTPYLLKNETVTQVLVKLGIILTCKPKCKGLFPGTKACKHHRTTQCKLANVKLRFFHFIYDIHLSQLHTLVKLASDNQLRPLTDSTSQYESMLPEAKLSSTCSISFALHVLFHMALACVNIPFLFCHRYLPDMTRR